MADDTGPTGAVGTQGPSICVASALPGDRDVDGDTRTKRQAIVWAIILAAYVVISMLLAIRYYAD